MSSFTTQTTADHQHLYRLTNGILNAHSVHFITISLLFLPLTFSASSAIKLYSSSLSDTDVTTMFDPFNLLLIKTVISSSQNLLHVKTLITIIAFVCLTILPTVAGVALITYSANQAIQRKPVDFSSTVKSLSHSYVPLLYTFIAGSIKLITILFLTVTLLPLAITKAIKALGFQYFIFSIFINLIFSLALVIIMLFFMTIWGSAAAITVLESKSGFESLRKSANQSTEFRRHSFIIVYLTGFVVGSALAYSNVDHQNSGPAANWFLILQVGTIYLQSSLMYLQSSLMILLYVVGNTVLYVQCKVASREENATTVEGEVSGEYVRLIVNDKDSEVVHELAKEETNGGFTYICCLLFLLWVILFM